MVLTSNLEQLGATGFQDLAAALTVATFGAHVQVMGGGRDGGRDMYYKGRLAWTNDGQPGEVWDGYTVFQVKHKSELASRPSTDAEWLWGQVREELDRWADPDLDRHPIPDYLIVVTNVPLSAVPTSGGHDQLNARMHSYIAKLKDDTRDTDRKSTEARKSRLARISKVKRWRFWGRAQIEALLACHADVRKAFQGFFTAADVFASLGDFTDSLPLNDLEPGLRAHARTTLMGEGSIYFDEAGSGDSTGIPLHRVAIDLPVTCGSDPRRTSVLHYVLDHAEHMLKPELTTQVGARHLVITGAPGNGKTTISKFLVQVYRAALLNGAAQLSADQRQIIRGTQSALERFGRRLPKNRRWPMRIDLADYAQEGGLAEDSTLLRWIAHKVSKRSNAGKVTPAALRSWMTQWPWFLVLDGLDEITDPTIRKRLIQQVTEFVNDAEADNCDTLVVLTTRPIGYTESIAPSHFERIDLDDLEPREAVAYGRLATQVRLRGDVDRIDRVLKQLQEAAEDEGLQNLLRTPLQVLILTIIVDGAGQLAPDRYSLFWGYYDTVFRRERDKRGGLHRMLQQYGQQIQQLHQRVGFELQVRSEEGGRSYATLTPDELRTLTWQVLEDSGFKPAGKDASLVENIFAAATRRLVLIAPRGNDGYGFDVRPLQELMAAMHLTAGPLDETLLQLRTSAASPHWRNTWIFAAGRLFSTPQVHQQAAIVDLIESIDVDADHRLGDIVPIGPRLALEVIDDGMARSLPRWRDRLIEYGLQVLREPASSDLPFIARALVRYAETGGEQRKAVAEGFRDALGWSVVAQVTAAKAQELIPSIIEATNAAPHIRGLAMVKKRPQDRLPAEPPDGWSDFEEEILTYPESGEGSLMLVPAAKACRRIGRTGAAREADVDAIKAALAYSGSAKALNAALGHVAWHDPALLRALRNDVLPPVHRAPIGAELRGQCATDH